MVHLLRHGRRARPACSCRSVMRRRSRCCEKILAADPNNLDAALRLATSHSSLGQEAQALEAFKRAAAIAPKSPDVRDSIWRCTTLAAMSWKQSIPILERIVEEQPERLAAIEGLAAVREKQGWLLDAVRLRQKAFSLRPATGPELAALGNLAMAALEKPMRRSTRSRKPAASGSGLQARPGTGRPAARRHRLPRPRRRSTVSPRVIPTIRWDCSSARRSASC